MFPICHIYFAGRVLDRLSDFTILGSIYPDIVISEMLTRDTTHYNTKSLYDYFMLKDESMKDFAIGAITHGTDMMGLDYYSDEYYPGLTKGYCFDRGQEIQKEVVECCKIPEAWGLWKAHNFIEMAFDLSLSSRHKCLIDSFRRVMGDDEIIGYASSKLGLMYGIPAESLYSSFKNFVTVTAYKDLCHHSIMEHYAYQLRKKHHIEGVDIQKGVSVLNQALDVIKTEQDEFFSYTVSRMRETLQL